MRFLEEGIEWRLSSLLYAADLVLWDESEENLRAMDGRFAEVCMRRGLKVNAGKSKMMVLGGEEELDCEVYVARICLEHGSGFKYLGCVLDESRTDGAEYSRKRVSGSRVADAIMSLVKTRDLQLECARVLHETLLVPILMYGRETML